MCRLHSDVFDELGLNDCTNMVLLYNNIPFAIYLH